MLICMRTTFIIDDDLYVQVKKLAVDQRCTATSVVEEALMKLIAEKTNVVEHYEPFHFKPMGQGGMRPGVDLNDSDQMNQILDEEEFTPALEEVLV